MYFREVPAARQAPPAHRRRTPSAMRRQQRTAPHVARQDDDRDRLYVRAPLIVRGGRAQGSSEGRCGCTGRCIAYARRRGDPHEGVTSRGRPAARSRAERNEGRRSLRRASTTSVSTGVQPRRSFSFTCLRDPAAHEPGSRGDVNVAPRQPEPCAPIRRRQRQLAQPGRQRSSCADDAPTGAGEGPRLSG